MANLKNAKKAILVNERNRQRNQAIKSRYKSALKVALAAISSNENAKEVVQKSCQIIDKTAAKGVIKKQTAARKKSNLMALLNSNSKNETKKAAPKKTAAKKAAPKKTTAKNS